MTTAAAAEPWRDVESLQDFVAYLRLLADECTRALEDDDSGTPVWTNRSINDFLWAWSSAVRRQAGPTDLGSTDLPPTDLLHRHDQPGWRGLASHLHLARTTKPAYNCMLADSNLPWDEVDSAFHLQMHLATLATEFAREQREIAELTRRGEPTGEAGSWAHRRLDGFLGAWAAWLEGAYLSPLPALPPLPALLVKLAIERRPVEPVTWRSIAFQLEIGRTYE